MVLLSIGWAGLSVTADPMLKRGWRRGPSKAERLNWPAGGRRHEQRR